MLGSSISKKCLCITAAASALLCGCGSGPADPLTKATVETTSADYTAADFVAKHDLDLRTLESEEQPARAVTIPSGTSLTVLETKVSATAGTIVRLGIDSPEGSELPADAWFPMDQALLLGLARMVDTVGETNDEEEPSLWQKISRGGMTYCFRYVKRYLLSTGKVSQYLPGESAWQAASILPKHGFRRTGNSPSSARDGEVCVYSGGPKGHGHVEVKRSGKWWFGYGFNAQPIRGRNFLGCFAKG